MSTAKKEDFRMSKQTKRILATLPKDEQPTFKKHMIDAEESFCLLYTSPSPRDS